MILNGNRQLIPYRFSILIMDSFTVSFISIYRMSSEDSEPKWWQLFLMHPPDTSCFTTGWRWLLDEERRDSLHSSLTEMEIDSMVSLQVGFPSVLRMRWQVCNHYIYQLKFIGSLLTHLHSLLLQCSNSVSDRRSHGEVNNSFIIHCASLETWLVSLIKSCGILNPACSI